MIHIRSVTRRSGIGLISAVDAVQCYLQLAVTIHLSLMSRIVSMIHSLLLPDRLYCASIRAQPDKPEHGE